MQRISCLTVKFLHFLLNYSFPTLYFACNKTYSLVKNLFSSKKLTFLLSLVALKSSILWQDMWLWIKCISCWHIFKYCSLWLYLNIIKYNFNCLGLWHSYGWFTCKNILRDGKKQGHSILDFWVGNPHISAGHTCQMLASLFFQLFSFWRVTLRQETSLPTSGSEKCLCLHIK